MAGRSKTTTDHEVIRKWVEDRGGIPSTVKRTEADDEPGVLRVDFPGYGRDEGRQSLEEISWDDFFQKFDEKDLAFLYQDEMKSGKPSRFFKFVSRGTAAAKEEQNRETDARHKGEGSDAKTEKRAAASSRSRKTTAEAKSQDGGEKKTEARGRAKSAEAGSGNGAEAKAPARRTTSRSKQGDGGESRAERDAKHAEAEAKHAGGEAKHAGGEAKQAERDAKQAGREARQEKK